MVAFAPSLDRNPACFAAFMQACTQEAHISDGPKFNTRIVPQLCHVSCLQDALCDAQRVDGTVSMVI